ncbi:MAG: S41 family peptidase [Pseudomonadota bacterium]
MKSHTITILAFLLSLNASAQSPNLHSDTLEWGEGDRLVEYLKITPEHGAKLDMSDAFTGETSIRIQRSYNAVGGFTSVGITVPATTERGRVTFEAAIKIDDIQGSAGLWMRQDGESGRIAYTSSGRNSLKGIQNWRLSDLSDELSPQTKTISAGVFLMGQGDIALDDLALSLNGKPLALDGSGFILIAAPDETAETGAPLNEISSTQAEHISQLVKVWGFLKYHHPAIAKRESPWDDEFLRLLPQIADAQNADERNAILTEWVTNLDQIQPCNPCQSKPADAVIMPDLAWIKDTTTLGENLSGQLQNIYQNRISADKRVYVKQGRFDQASFDRELPYESGEIKQANYRMLAIARYWNIVQYWFPYRDLIDESWDDLLPRYLVESASAETDFDYYQVMTRLVAEADDSHAIIPSHMGVIPPFGVCDLPVEIRFIEKAPTIVAYRPLHQEHPTGLEIGDVIMQIDNRPVGTLLEQIRPFYSASNISAQNRDIANNLIRGDCGYAELVVDRAGAALSIRAERIHEGRFTGNRRPLPASLPGDTAQILNGNIGYIKLASATQAQVDAYIEVLRDTKGIIIDIRDAPGEDMAYFLGRWFAAKPTPFVKLIRPDFRTPGAFIWIDDPPAIPPVPDGLRLDLPLAILVDERTQSSAEYTAMALQALPNATVIGSQTAGANGNVSRFILPGGLNTRISGLGVYYPDETPTQRFGLKLDIDVSPTRQGILEGRDEVLDRAIQLISNPQLGEPTSAPAR